VADGVSLCCAFRYIADDELVEVTPKIVRLRKKKLDPTERKKLSRQVM
jgi:GTP-binding protein